MSNVIVNDLMVTYERSGKGPVVVLLHGWGDSSHTFAQLCTALSSTRETIVVDLPGFGGTQAPPRPWGLSDYADFLGNFTKKIGVASVFAYVGHSNGGAIAIRGLAKGSITSEKLVLLASAGIRSENKTRTKSLRLLGRSAKLLTKPLPSSMQKKLKKRAYKAIGSDLFVAEHLQETFVKIVADDVRADAARLKLPTLLLYGEQDTATPIAWGRKLAANITGSKFESVASAGHFVHHDQAQRVNDVVREFLDD